MLRAARASGRSRLGKRAGVFLVRPGDPARIHLEGFATPIGKLADLSIRRPVFAVMLIGGLVLLGLISIPRLGLDLFPRVEFPIVTVQTVLEGASPETLEREVSQVLEESINTIEGIQTLSSQSSEGLSLLFVEFELDANVREKAQQVRDRVAASLAELPRDVHAPVVERIAPDAAPSLAVMLAGPQSIRAQSELADKSVKPRLERIAGVGSVQLVGARPRQIRIYLLGCHAHLPLITSRVRHRHTDHDLRRRIRGELRVAPAPIFITRASGSVVDARACSRRCGFFFAATAGSCSSALATRSSRSRAARCRRSVVPARL